MTATESVQISGRNESVLPVQAPSAIVSNASTAATAAGGIITIVSPELRLSASGRAVYEEIVPVAQAYETELLAALPPDARAAFDALITALTTRAEALSR